MSKDILLSEVEGLWCRKCESVVHVHPGDEVGLICGCDGFIASIEEIPSKWTQCRVKAYEIIKIDPIYYTDSYPIEGCTVRVLASKTKGRFCVSVYAPESQGGMKISSYMSMNLNQTVDSVKCLLKCEAVPKVPS